LTVITCRPFYIENRSGERSAIDAITRVNDNSNGGTLIDHIFTSIKHDSIFKVLDYECSDHKAIITSLDIPLIRPKDYKKQVRKFSEDNWQKFLDLLLKGRLSIRK
jgi:malonyl CoA-acyl carrier protein transacylase